jgi:DNA-nicking Smr family endonuclease
VSAEEADLWRYVTRSVRPLAEQPGRDRSALPIDQDALQTEVERMSRPGADARTPRSMPAPARRATPAPAPKPRPQPAENGPPRVLGNPPTSRPPVGLPPVGLPPTAVPPPSLDRRAARRIAGGATAIEARIDLHGFYQDEAHARLRSFIRTCHARGLRTVLVITGKGGTGDRRHDGRQPLDLWSPGSERGVLKRNVPRWLAEPGLAELIVSVGSAAVPHGGEGALYVVLRRKARSGEG